MGAIASHLHQASHPPALLMLLPAHIRCPSQSQFVPTINTLCSEKSQLIAFLQFSSCICIVFWGRFLLQTKSERPEEGDGDISAMAKQNGSIRSGRHYSIAFNAQPLFAVIRIPELS